MTIRILVVDDDELFFQTLEMAFYETKVELTWAPDGKSALRSLEANEFDIAVVDFDLPDSKGDEVATKIKSISPEVQIVFATGHSELDILARLLKSGAQSQFFFKGTHPEEIRQIIMETYDRYSRQLKVLGSSSEIVSVDEDDLGMIGVSEEMRRVRRKILRYRPVDSSVLILGESGTGKELVANALRATPEAGWIAINCAKYQANEALMESELFGHVRGAFTGADKNHTGLLERAAGGVVFFDEIHCLSLAAQQKLLRAFQEKKIRRLGDSEEREIHASFRIVAATKPDIQERIAQGEFLIDLYFRINALTIQIPPLCHRLEDIEPLVFHFLDQFNSKFGHKKGIRSGTLLKMKAYSWPGNIRELRNALERMYIDSDGEVLEPSDFEEYVSAQRGASPKETQAEIFKYRDYMDRAEEAFFTSILKASPDVDYAAKEAGLPRSTFYRKLKRIGIQP